MHHMMRASHRLRFWAKPNSEDNVAASRMDAVLNSNQVIFHQLNASRRRQQINRFVLVQADGGTFQPLCGLLLGSED
ncbi:hypothetical protein V1277_002747 [Bradyrhizobium sp. AZCC 1588]